MGFKVESGKSIGPPTSSSSASTTKSTLRGRITSLESKSDALQKQVAVLENDLDEVTRDLYLANEAIGCNDR